jgi:hypothetical protein
VQLKVGNPVYGRVSMLIARGSKKATSY